MNFDTLLCAIDNSGRLLVLTEVDAFITFSGDVMAVRDHWLDVLFW